MPQLVKSVQGEILEVTTGSVETLRPIVGKIQNTDYIKLDGFIAYLQNFTNVMSSEELKKPIMFGLKNMTTQVVLEISY